MERWTYKYLNKTFCNLVLSDLFFKCHFSKEQNLNISKWQTALLKKCKPTPNREILVASLNLYNISVGSVTNRCPEDVHPKPLVLSLPS